MPLDASKADAKAREEEAKSQKAAAKTQPKADTKAKAKVALPKMAVKAAVRGPPGLEEVEDDTRTVAPNSPKGKGNPGKSPQVSEPSTANFGEFTCEIATPGFDMFLSEMGPGPLQPGEEHAVHSFLQVAASMGDALEAMKKQEAMVAAAKEGIKTFLKGSGLLGSDDGAAMAVMMVAAATAGKINKATRAGGQDPRAAAMAVVYAVCGRVMMICEQAELDEIDGHCKELAEQTHEVGEYAVGLYHELAQGRFNPDAVRREIGKYVQSLQGIVSVVQCETGEANEGMMAAVRDAIWAFGAKVQRHNQERERKSAEAVAAKRAEEDTKERASAEAAKEKGGAAAAINGLLVVHTVPGCMAVENIVAVSRMIGVETVVHDGPTCRYIRADTWEQGQVFMRQEMAKEGPPQAASDLFERFFAHMSKLGMTITLHSLAICKQCLLAIAVWLNLDGIIVS